MKTFLLLLLLLLLLQSHLLQVRHVGPLSVQQLQEQLIEFIFQLLSLFFIHSDFELDETKPPGHCHSLPGIDWVSLVNFSKRVRPSKY